MMMTSRKCAGTLAAALAMVFAGCGGEIDDAEEVESTSAALGDSEPKPDDGKEKCAWCVKIREDKNITHIFVKVPKHRKFSVFVEEKDGKKKEIDPKRFHDGDTGPCNHGEDLIKRNIWFPLTGNQKAVKVCVVIKDNFDGKNDSDGYGFDGKGDFDGKDGFDHKVVIGWKTGDGCFQDKAELVCKRECPPKDHSKTAWPPKDECPPENNH